MKLPIPINDNGKIYEEITTRRPSGGVMADTLSLMQTRDQYSATAKFLSGIIERVGTVTDKIQVDRLIEKMYYKSAELVALNAARELHEDDSIEGVYPCPRCGHQIVCEKDEDGNYDTTDKVSDFTVNYIDTFGFRIDLKYPKKINTNEGEMEVSSLDLDYIRIENGIAASRYNDHSGFKFRLYAETITHVNGQEVDKKFKSRYGYEIFKAMDVADLGEVNKRNNEPGIQPYSKKTCPACNKKFDARVKTSNFFGSALRSD